MLDVDQKVALLEYGMRPTSSTSPSVSRLSARSVAMGSRERNGDSSSACGAATVSVEAGAPVPVAGLERAAAVRTRGPTSGHDVAGPVDEADDLLTTQREASLGRIVVVVVGHLLCEDHESVVVGGVRDADCPDRPRRNDRLAQAQIRGSGPIETSGRSSSTCVR